MTPWHPNYWHLRWRLSAAAEAVEKRDSREALQDAISVLCPFMPDQFPEQFRAEFEQIVSVGGTTDTLSHEEVRVIGKRIVALHRGVVAALFRVSNTAEP